MRRKHVLLLGLTAIAAIVAIACSDSDNDEPAHTGPDNGDILAALATLDAASLHHVESTLIGDDPAIDPAWLGPLINARTAVALIDWPESLHEATEDFLNDSMTLLEALQADDLEAATDAAPAAHTAWHLLKDPGYAYLAEQAGTGAAAGDHDDDHDAEEEDHDDS